MRERTIICLTFIIAIVLLVAIQWRLQSYHNSHLSRQPVKSGEQQLQQQTSPKNDVPASRQEIETKKTVAIEESKKGDVEPQEVAPLTVANVADPQQRAKAVDEWGFRDEPKYEAMVIQVLQNDPVAEVRVKAAAALEGHTSSQAVASLVAALADTDEDVRKNALISLSTIRNEEVQKQLRQLLDHGTLEQSTAEAVQLFLHRHYLSTNPFARIESR